MREESILQTSLTAITCADRNNFRQLANYAINIVHFGGITMVMDDKMAKTIFNATSNCPAKCL